MSGVKRHKTARVKVFLREYGSPDVGLNATEAARRAGYKDAEESGWQLKRKWPEEVQAIEDRWNEQKRLSETELEEIPASIARSTTSSEQNRLKALELIAKMRGKLKDNVSINVTRGDMLKQIDEAIATLRQVAKGSELVADTTNAEETIIPVTGTPPN